MQEGLRERAQAGRPWGKRNPGPLNHPFQNRTWLESSTVKTVSKEMGNKSKQGQVFLFLMHLMITLPQAALLTVQIKSLATQQISVSICSSGVKSKLTNPSQFIHRLTRRRSSFLLLPAPADSLHS